MRKVLPLLLTVFCSILAYAAEISAFGYRVAADSTSTRIYYKGMLLQKQAFMDVVEGPGWKRSLLNQKNVAQQKVEVVGDKLQVTIASPEATAYITASISENGVTQAVRYDATVANVGEAAFWFCALPLDRFADREFTIPDIRKSFKLPTTLDRETVKKSKWFLGPQGIKAVQFDCAEGTLEVTGDIDFHVFDARYHYFNNAVGCRSNTKLKRGQTYSFNLKFIEKPEVTMVNPDYEVKADKNGMQITYKGNVIQSFARTCIVEGPGWKHTLCGDDGLSSKAKITTEGALITAEFTGENVYAKMTAEVQADGVELTYFFDTKANPLASADFWFATLPLKDCAGRNYIIDPIVFNKAPEVRVLPPVNELDSVPKSRWRLHNDTREIRIFMDYGILEILADNPIYLFDGRFHGYFLPQCQTISARTKDVLNPRQTYRFKLRVQPNDTIIVPEAATEKQVFMLRPMTAPTIDGKLSPEEWQDASKFQLHALNGQKITAGTTAYAGYDEENIYLAYRCEEPRGREILKQPKRDVVYANDNVETMICTDGDMGFKQIQADVHGRLHVNHQGAKPLYELKDEKVTHKTTVDDKGWTVEIAFPMKEIGITADAVKFMIANMARTRFMTGAPDDKVENSSVAYIENSFQELHNMLPMRFANRPNALPFADAEHRVDLTAGKAWVNVQYNLAEGVAPRKVLPRLRVGTEKKLRNIDLPVVELNGERPFIGTFSFNVTKDDEYFFIQLWDNTKSYLLSSQGPYYFAQNSLSGELAKFAGQLPELAEKLHAADGLKDLKDEIATTTAQYASSLDDAVVAKAADLAHTYQRLQLLAKQNCADAYQSHLAYYVTSPLIKILRSNNLDDKVTFGGALEFEGAGDEVVNGQLVLVPVDRDLSVVTPTVSDLRTADGKVLPAKQVTVFVVEDVALFTKMWPDRLHTHYKGIPRAMNQQPMWVSVKIPAGTPAGTYKGSITFAAAEGSVNVPISVQTYGWDLPRIRRVFAWAGLNRMVFPKGDAMDYRRELISRDLFPAGQGLPHPIWFDTTDFDVDEDNLMTLEPMNMVLAGEFPWQSWLDSFYRNGKFKNAKEYYDNISDHIRKGMPLIREAGAQDVAYIYYDEIGVGEDLVKETLMTLKKECGLKVMTCFCTPSLGTSKVEYYREMIDYFIFSGDHFTDPKWLDYMDELRKDGAKIAWYFNVSYPSMPTSNVIDCPGTVNRIQFFHQWKYKVDMSLYWGSLNYEFEYNPEKYVFKNRGDGTLFYRTKEDSYTPSIRSELLRDGCQDYRYLEFLQNLFNEKKDKVPTVLANEIKDILDVTWIKSVTEFPEDPVTIVKQRKRIVNAIQKLKAL